MSQSHATERLKLNFAARWHEKITLLAFQFTQLSGLDPQFTESRKKIRKLTGTSKNRSKLRIDLIYFYLHKLKKKILTEISPNFEMISTPATLTRVPTLFLPVTIFRSSVKAKESSHQPEWELERARARARRLRLNIWLTINYISIRALGLIFTKACSLPFCERSKASLPRSLKLHFRSI